jgi:hypothetical protein
VIRVDPGELSVMIFFFSLAISRTAKAGDDEATSRMASTLSVSNHLRAVVGSNIRLVLVICEYDFDRHAEDLAAEILHGHLRRSHRTLAGNVGIDARHILDDADTDDAIRDLSQFCAEDRSRCTEA